MDRDRDRDRHRVTASAAEEAGNRKKRRLAL